MTGIKPKRVDLSFQEKQKILQLYDKLPKMSQRSAAGCLKISQPLLSKILKLRIHLESAGQSNKNMERKRSRTGKDSKVESALKAWYNTARENNFPITGPIMRQKAEELAGTMGRDGFVATDGWFYRWKKRENIIFDCPYNKEDTEMESSVWIKTKWAKIFENYTPENVYKADEIKLELFQIEGGKMTKERVTVLCCVNVIGEKRDLLVIGKSENIQVLHDLGVNYIYSVSGWMTKTIFTDWLNKWNSELNRKVVLLVDNCSTHTNIGLLKNIKLITVPTNIQSCQLSFIKTFKNNYQRLVSIEEKKQANANKNKQKNAAKKTFIDGLHLLTKSWKKISSKSIQNSFQKGGYVIMKSETPEECDSTVKTRKKCRHSENQYDFEDGIDTENNTEATSMEFEVKATINVKNQKCKSLDIFETNIHTETEMSIESVEKTFGRCLCDELQNGKCTDNLEDRDCTYKETKKELVLTDEANGCHSGDIFEEEFESLEDMEVPRETGDLDSCDDEEIKQNGYTIDTDPPSVKDMLEALRILRRGVLHRTKDPQKHYEYEDYIKKVVLRSNR